MDSTAKTTINPAEIPGIETMLDKLLEHVEFSQFPVDLICIALNRARAILSAMQQCDSQDVPHLADAGQAEVDTAIELTLAWDRQQSREARELGE